MSTENETSVPVVEEITQETEDTTAAVFFEDDEEVMLRDGKTYRIPPLNLKKARRFIEHLKVINVDVILMNFLPTENDVNDTDRIDRLFDMLLMAFASYPEVTKEYIDEYVDLEIARRIVEIMIGLNGVKK